MISTVGLAVAAGVGLVGVGGGLFAGLRYGETRARDQDWEAQVEHATDGNKVTIPAPETSSGLLDAYREYRHKSKRKKLAKRGYVRWYKLDGMLGAPEWVKPERDGSGVAKYYDSDDGCHYLFPTAPLVTDSRTGAPVAIHKAGEAEPINLSDPAYPPMDSDRLEEVINLEIESDPPSWLSKFDINSQTIMYLMIAGVLAFAAFQQFMGG